MQSSIFMWYRRFQEGRNLNIEIHEYFRRLNIFSSKHIDSPCKASIKFDDLWEHLVSEAQRETNCTLIFASINSHWLRIPQRTSRSSSLIPFQDSSSGLSLRYAFDDYLCRFPPELWSQGYNSDLRALDAQIKSTAKSLESFKPLLSCLGRADAGAGMLIEFYKVITGVISYFLACAHIIWLEAAQFCSSNSGQLHWRRIQSQPHSFSTQIIQLINL